MCSSDLRGGVLISQHIVVPHFTSLFSDNYYLVGVLKPGCLFTIDNYVPV